MRPSPRRSLALVVLCAVAAAPAVARAETMVPAGNMNSSQVWKVRGGLALRHHRRRHRHRRLHADHRGWRSRGVRHRRRPPGLRGGQRAHRAAHRWRPRDAGNDAAADRVPVAAGVSATGDYLRCGRHRHRYRHDASSNFSHGQTCLHLKGSGAVRVTGRRSSISAATASRRRRARRKSRARPSFAPRATASTSGGQRDRRATSWCATAEELRRLRLDQLAVLTDSVIRRNASIGVYIYNSTRAHDVDAAPHHLRRERRLRRLPLPRRRYLQRHVPGQSRRQQRRLWRVRERQPVGDDRPQPRLGAHLRGLQQPVGGHGFPLREPAPRRYRAATCDPPRARACAWPPPTRATSARSSTTAPPRRSSPATCTWTPCSPRPRRLTAWSGT